MWSYVQYQRIGRRLRAEIGQGSRSTGNQSRGDDAEKTQEHSRFGRAPSPGPAPPSPSPSNNHDTDTSGYKFKDDRIIVCAAGDRDPFDPRNWSRMERSKNIAILSLLIFVQAWAGAAESMGSAQASQEFHVTRTAETLITAMYLFGVGTGSLFAGPLSESVGRNPTYLVSTFCYLLFVLGAALSRSFGSRIVCRYFMGLFSSATLAINGSSVRDQFHDVKRTFVFPVIAWANVAAPVIAPIAGGWISSHPRLGWRWTEWITLIISAFAFLIAFLFLPETYLPVLLDWKAMQLRRITGDDRYVSEHEEKPSFFKLMKKILPMPAQFLPTEPVIGVLGGYLVLLYILLFTFLSGFDYIFKQTYGLSTGQTGSCFGAIAAGSSTFLLAAYPLYRWSRDETDHVRRAKVTPEFRLWPGVVAAPFLPICLFWLGWSNYSTISIWSSLGACFVFGVVLITMYVSSYEYIIDSYGEHAAIALASITMTRYLIAGGMVVVARPMYDGIGVHWTLTLLGCIAAILTPAPALFYIYGSKLRKKSPYARDD